MSLRITSEAFGDSQPIPRKYTDDGENVSPPLHVHGLPKGTKELAVIVDDPDAPLDEPLVHWVMYKVRQKDLPEGIPASPQPQAPAGAVQGLNSFGTIGYAGPAPPQGHGVHHYRFHVYALDLPLEVPEGLDKKALMTAMMGRVIGDGVIVGSYRR
jgi:Raf kinase inhibitor-like YbhB/YbcL family protein